MKENIAVSPTESRQSERYTALPNRQGRLSFSIEGQSETHGILMLQNISPFGVGVESKRLIEKGERIQLMYEEAGLVLAVVGVVAWHKRSETTKTDAADQVQYQLGIEFYPANIAKNVYFFRYMSGMK